MIDDLALRWVVTVLFALSAAQCTLTIAATRQGATAAIGHVLHLLMAVAMVVMAWPRGAGLPTAAPMVFCVLAASWFVVVMTMTGGARAAQAKAAYYAVTMLAMAWMYAVMNGGILPAPSGADDAGAHASRIHAMDVAGSPPADAPVLRTPSWIATADWAITIGCAVACIWWLYHYFELRRSMPGPLSHHHLGALCQAMMAAGMAIMFAVML